MPASKNKLEYIDKWAKEHCKYVQLKLNIEYDADIIEYLEKCENKNATLKKLIREQIKNEG